MNALCIFPNARHEVSVFDLVHETMMNLDLYCAQHERMIVDGECPKCVPRCGNCNQLDDECMCFEDAYAETQQELAAYENGFIDRQEARYARRIR